MASMPLKSVACEYCGNYKVYSPDGKERICLDKERILGKQIETG